MTELSHEARTLIEQGRASDAPDARDRARIRERLMGELGAGAFSTAAVASVALSSSHASVAVNGAAAATGAVRRAKHASSVWLKAAAAVVAVGGGALLYVANVSPAPQAAPRTRAMVAQREQPAALASSDETRTTAEAALARARPEPAAHVDMAGDSAFEPGADAHSAALMRETKLEARSSSATRVRPKRPRAIAESGEGELPSAARTGAASTGTAVERAEASTLSAELALLARAQRALRDGKAREALTITEQHAAQFSASDFAQERAGIETLARCMLGERREANARAFLARAPNSPLAARVRKECGLE